MEHVKRVGRKLVHAGAIVDIYEDDMVLPDGSHETWDFVSHRMGAACVLPVLDDGRLVMIRQYRPALDRFTLEVPAGCRDSLDEDTRLTAARELREETGYTGEEIEFMLSLKSTVAFCDEFIDVYLARGLKSGEQQLDEAESIDVEYFTLNELLDLIYAGTIQDSKTVSAILAYANLLSKGE